MVGTVSSKGEAHLLVYKVQFAGACVIDVDYDGSPMQYRLKCVGSSHADALNTINVKKCVFMVMNVLRNAKYSA